MIFFLVGILLAMFQVELFTAFLWLIECSVLFVFLLLLFFLNSKNVFKQTKKQIYKQLVILLIMYYVVILYSVGSSENVTPIFVCIDNIYETIQNVIQNDLFVFFISYYILNSVEFLIVGFLLFLGSVLCVNLYQLIINTRTQVYKPFLSLFDFFFDFSTFLFLRKQNLIRQGNTKASLKIFQKK